MPPYREEMLPLLDLEYRTYMERLKAEANPLLSELSVAVARKLMRDMQRTDVSSYPVHAKRHMLDGFSVLILQAGTARGTSDGRIEEPASNSPN